MIIEVILHVPLSDVSPANAMDTIMKQGRVIRRKFPMLGSDMRRGLDLNEPYISRDQSMVLFICD